MIKVRGLSGGYGHHVVVQNISFTVTEGEFFGIIGPNGSGKSTLLRLLSGIEKPKAGDVLLQNRSIFSLSRKAIAKIMAVLPQEQQPSFSFRVREVVEMGRHPYQRGFIPVYSKHDNGIIDEVLDFLQLADIQHKPLHHLSGGQKQRVILARVLAQQPQIILLDEPTNHLDVFYQVEILDLLKRWMIEKKTTIISVLHDLNITSLYADRILALDKQGHVAALGTTKEVLSSELIYQIFGLRMLQVNHPHIDKPQFLLLIQ